MDDDSRVIDKGWDALPEYGSTSGDADDAVTVSISTTPGEWLVNTVDAVVVPMSMAEVVEALQTHKLTDRSLVWRAGMQEWAPVEKVPQLKLAARMSPIKTAASSAAPRAAAMSVPPRPATAAATPAPSKPPPKPLRTTPPPAVGPASVPPQAIPSRKATLPFGLTAPLVAQSRPASSRPSQPSQARIALPPAASKEEPEVLAVYDRPAATISFDLSPEQPLRAPPPSVPAPQTLAPTTTDSAQRRAPAPRNADLSVVAASDFRQVQRSSKRLVLISSLASAAAASLVTFALSRGHTANTGPATPAEVVAPPIAAAPAAPAPTPLAPTPPPSVAPAPEPPPAEVSPPVPVAEKPKPAARKAKAAAAPRPRPQPVEPAAPRDPASEPNPYDVKLDEEAPSAKPAPAPAATHGSGLEADNDAPQASSSSNASPGF